MRNFFTHDVGFGWNKKSKLALPILVSFHTYSKNLINWSISEKKQSNECTVSQAVIKALKEIIT